MRAGSVQKFSTSRHSCPEHQVVAQHSAFDDAKAARLGQMAQRRKVGN